MNDLIIVIKKIVCRYVSLVGIFILLLVAGCYSGVNKTVSNNKFAIEKHRKLYFPKTTVKLNHNINKDKIWVFIMAGQSNMAGRGFVEPQDTIPDNRVLTINRNNSIVIAKEPLHFYEPSMTGLDCGLTFGKRLIKDIPEDIQILMIPTAVGGSSIRKWLGDSLHRNVKLLTNFKHRTEFAKTVGQIKGILWLQGESDAKNSDGYGKCLEKLVYKFREITEDKSMPVLIGKIGSFSNNKEKWNKINSKIHTYSNSDKNIEVITTSDLKDRGDKLHFNSKGQRKIGIRFAEKYLNMKKE